MTGEARRNAVIAGAPAAEGAHGLDEFFAGASQRVGYLWRRGSLYLAVNDAVGFELA